MCCYHVCLLAGRGRHDNALMQVTVWLLRGWVGACVLANDEVWEGRQLSSSRCVCVCVQWSSLCPCCWFLYLGNTVMATVVWTWCCLPAACVCVWEGHTHRQLGGSTHVHFKPSLWLSVFVVLNKPVNHAGCIFPFPHWMMKWTCAHTIYPAKQQLNYFKW